MVGRDRADGRASILGNLEQSMFGETLYCTREEPAAHLLYFVIKNHPFSDGNKRSGVFLFLLYLRPGGRAPDHEPDRRSGSDAGRPNPGAMTNEQRASKSGRADPRGKYMNFES